jgi:hypothetical protein
MKRYETTLIIALGLLVDVPVVSGDAIKNLLAGGSPRLIASWLGPTNLITAITSPRSPISSLTCHTTQTDDNEERKLRKVLAQAEASVAHSVNP